MLTTAAITLTLTVLSRPTAALMCVAVFPIFIEFVAKTARKNFRACAMCICAFVLPLLAGACFVMWHNAARFGSPVDFGAAYQLTVSDISKNTFEKGFFQSAIISYFLYPLWLTDTPQEIMMGGQILMPPEARYVYGDSYAGAFAHALPLAVIFYRRVMECDREEKKREHTKNAFVVLVCALAVFVAFFNFCYAGVNMRYIYDIVAMLSLVGSFVLLDLQARAEGYKKIFITLVCLVFFCAAVSASDAAVETIRLRF